MRTNCLKSSSKPQEINGRIRPNGRAGYSVERDRKYTPVNGSDLIPGLTEDEEFNSKLFRLHGGAELRSILEANAALGLSNVPNSHRDGKRIAKRGSKGLTSHGRSQVFNGIEYLQWRFGRRQLSFGTVTLPAMTREQDEQVTQEWSQIVRIFVQNLRRKLNATSLPNGIVGASEMQSRRSERDGVAALHLHFVFVGRLPKSHWRITPKTIRSAWRGAVVSRVPSLADTSFCATEHIVAVKHSVSGYLAKYLTKGSGVVGNVDAASSPNHPNSWYTISRHLSKIIGRTTRSGRYIGAFLSNLEDQYWLYKRAVKIKDGNGQEFTIGWFGQLKPGWSQFIDVPVFIPIEESMSFVLLFPLPKVFHDGYYSIVLNVGLLHALRPTSDGKAEG